MMTNKEEIERVKLKIIIYKRAYNSYFNQLMVTLVVLFLNIVLFVIDHKWFNAMAIGGLLISFIYIWVNMKLEYDDLKFYTQLLHRILIKDEDEIDSLNNILRLQIYAKDMKNEP